ncbi:hypothetical protein K7711_19150 [Nocardia sp. CA2R105]|uniref:hypothetical protein n=1 Tax=Nocardia coffeae TaxID=2873381 RepID=UPI001CA630FA|nr:hypothetical protein [Nocardia coffeae]MBY8858604.1 hypothetical protein [Nocardia coffeae]
MNSRPLPGPVLQEVTTLLSWLDWIVLLLCVARLVWIGGQLAVRLYREEAIEGLLGSLLAVTMLGAAGGFARALLPVQ